MSEQEESETQEAPGAQGGGEQDDTKNEQKTSETTSQESKPDIIDVSDYVQPGFQNTKGKRQLRIVLTFTDKKYNLRGKDLYKTFKENDLKIYVGSLRYFCTRIRKKEVTENDITAEKTLMGDKIVITIDNYTQQEHFKL